MKKHTRLLTGALLLVILALSVCPLAASAGTVTETVKMLDYHTAYDSDTLWSSVPENNKVVELNFGCYHKSEEFTPNVIFWKNYTYNADEKSVEISSTGANSNGIQYYVKRPGTAMAPYSVVSLSFDFYYSGADSDGLRLIMRDTVLEQDVTVARVDTAGNFYTYATPEQEETDTVAIGTAVTGWNTVGVYLLPVYDAVTPTTVTGYTLYFTMNAPLGTAIAYDTLTTCPSYFVGRGQLDNDTFLVMRSLGTTSTPEAPEHLKLKGFRTCGLTEHAADLTSVGTVAVPRYSSTPAWAGTDPTVTDGVVTFGDATTPVYNASDASCSISVTAPLTDANGEYLQWNHRAGTGAVTAQAGLTAQSYEIYFDPATFDGLTNSLGFYRISATGVLTCDTSAEDTSAVTVGQLTAGWNTVTVYYQPRYSGVAITGLTVRFALNRTDTFISAVSLAALPAYDAGAVVNQYSLAENVRYSTLGTTAAASAPETLQMRNLCQYCFFDSESVALTFAGHADLTVNHPTGTPYTLPSATAVSFWEADDIRYTPGTAYIPAAATAFSAVTDTDVAYETVAAAAAAVDTEDFNTLPERLLALHAALSNPLISATDSRAVAAQGIRDDAIAAVASLIRNDIGVATNSRDLFYKYNALIDAVYFYHTLKDLLPAASGEALGAALTAYNTIVNGINADQLDGITVSVAVSAWKTGNPDIAVILADIKSKIPR